MILILPVFTPKQFTSVFETKVTVGTVVALLILTNPSFVLGRYAQFGVLLFATKVFGFSCACNKAGGVTDSKEPIVKAVNAPGAAVEVGKVSVTTFDPSGNVTPLEAEH